MANTKYKSNHNVPYTIHYKENCFIAWYASGRPDKIPQIQKIIPEDELERKPGIGVLASWRDEMGWDWRADELDAKADSVVENELVNMRVVMLKEQASRGKELQTKGMEYLRDSGFDTSSSAVSAIFKGADLERTSRGISDRIVKLLQLDDDKLLGRVQKLLDEASDSGEIIDIDATEVEEENGE